MLSHAVSQINYEKIYFVAILYYQKDQIVRLFTYYQYLGSFFIRIWEFDPRVTFFWIICAKSQK